MGKIGSRKLRNSKDSPQSHIKKKLVFEYFMNIVAINFFGFEM